MSYCRWSSDDFQCDLYCYEDANGGWTTHVAGNRIVGDIPKADHLLKTDTIAEYIEAHQRQSEFLRTAKRAPIGLAYDGESFNDPDLESFLDRLMHLREVGYNFPDYILEAVREEIAEGSSGPTPPVDKEG